jgi:hypothetical protein
VAHQVSGGHCRYVTLKNFAGGAGGQAAGARFQAAASAGTLQYTPGLQVLKLPAEKFMIYQMPIEMRCAA